MSEIKTKQEIIQYQPAGVCCKLMQIQVCDGVVEDAQFHGGCSGNLIGLRNLIKGMKIEDVIEKLKDTPCGPKSTSCPDQIAQCLMAYKNNQVESV